MGQLPARVFEEKLPACRVEDGKEVYKESRGKNGDASAVLGEKKIRFPLSLPLLASRSSSSTAFSLTLSRLPQSAVSGQYARVGT